MSALARPVLVGDGIENPGNAAAMRDAARVFGWHVALRDRKAGVELSAADGPVVAFDNLPGARSVYGFRCGGSPAQVALVVGNERRGLSYEMRRVATHAVEIPMASRRVNCLNVAAASAVGLFYLSRGGGGRQPVRSDPERVRPEVLFVGPGDHVELGSALRSAAAFGWRRAFVEDRDGVWFGAGRARTTEGRAAARRAKNSIRVVPTGGERRFAYEEVVLVVADVGTRPLVRTNLARGARQLIVLPDPARVDIEAEEIGRFGGRVEVAGLGLPALAANESVRYRLFATIALAEIARQVGTRAPRVPRRLGPPTFDRSLRVLEETTGETYSLAELMDY